MSTKTSISADVQLPLSQDDAWQLINNGKRVASWWPRATRAENVGGHGFTLVVESKRGVPVRIDWLITKARKPLLIVFEQEIAGTPFEPAFVKNSLTIELEALTSDTCLARATSNRELVQNGPLAGWFGRRSARRQLHDLLSGLKRGAEQLPAQPS